jgi:hypothetical protein
LLSFDKQKMDDTMDSTTLSWKQLRRTLQRSGEGNDVAKGMSQFGEQRQRLNPKITMHRGDSNLPSENLEERPNYEEYVSPIPQPIPSKYYAVAVCRRVGVYDSWEETKTNVNGL